MIQQPEDKCCLASLKETSGQAGTHMYSTLLVFSSLGEQHPPTYLARTPTSISACTCRQDAAQDADRLQFPTVPQAAGCSHLAVAAAGLLTRCQAQPLCELWI